MRLRPTAALAASLVSSLLAACAPSPRPQAPTAAPAAAGRPLDSWARGAVFYEVFVRSFFDSDGDGKGDLRGLAQKLDYLREAAPGTGGALGVDALWLMPVFASPSYHGYDTTDYDRVNPDYGTNEDLVALCKKAHARGMKVIVDLVLNHTSDKHPWFVEAASSRTSPHRDFYVWRDADPGWGQPWNAAGHSWHPSPAGDGTFYYGLFTSRMPDLNFENPAVRAEARRIAKEWLDRGVDGFRLDASRHLVETGPGEGQSDTAATHAFWKDFAAYVRSVRADALLVGENWTDTPLIARYYGDTTRVPGGDELPLSFDFPLAQRLIASARQREAGLVADKLDEIARAYPAGATDVPFLANHDMVRVATNLKQDAGALRVAAAMMLTLPGTPFLYYGEEIGMENGPGNEDEWKRTPMPWDATAAGGFTTGKPWHALAPGQAQANVASQQKDPASLYHHYARLLAARHAEPAIGRGHLDLLTREGPVLAYTLTDGKRRLLVAHNLDEEKRAQPLAVVGVVAAAVLAAPGASARREGDAILVELPARGSAVWRLEPSP